MKTYRIKAGCGSHTDQDGKVYEAGDLFVPSNDEELEQLRFKLEEASVAPRSDDNQEDDAFDPASFDGPYDEETLSNLTVVELRALAQHVGASTTGNKPSLVTKIVAHAASQASEEPPPPPTE